MNKGDRKSDPPLNAEEISVEKIRLKKKETSPRRSFVGRVLAAIFGAASFFFAWLKMKETSSMKTKEFVETGKDAVENEFSLGLHFPVQDPFLFCAHHLDDYPRGDDSEATSADLTGRNMGSDFDLKDGFRMYHGEKVPGFPVHPHRGFETVTIVRRGVVDHADSLGAAGRYGAGDVQWMTAGSGVQHSEMFPLVNQDEKNPLELFQVWLNLPAANKFTKPDFKMFWSEHIPVVENDQVALEVISGNFEGVRGLQAPSASWASQKDSDLVIAILTLKQAGKFTLFSAELGLTRFLYFYEGKSALVGGGSVSSGTGFQLNSSESLSLENKDKEPAKFLLLQGRPIGEPVFQHGPFVMNTKEEVIQAFRDYRATEFGGWPWPRRDMVHGSQSGRFAKFPNGKKEFPG